MTKKIRKAEQFAFSHWSRASYAPFASLGREVKVCVLSVTMCIVLPATEIKGQEASVAIDDIVEMDEVDIVGDAIAPVPSILTPVTLFERTSETSSPLQTIEAALSVSPSIDIRQRGGKGVQADIQIRGASFDQTMIMLNGINFTDARTGHQTHSLPIDIDAVSSISLMEGITATGAYAGAVNIVTTPAEPEYLSARLEAGAYGYMYANLSGAIKKGGFSLFGATSVRKSDGYAENTDFINYNGFIRGTYHSRKGGVLDMQLGYQNRSFGANSFYSLSYPDQYEHTSTIISSLRWCAEIYKNLSISISAAYRKNYDRFELVQNNPTAVPYNYHNTDNITAEMWLSYLSIAGKTTLGGNYYYNHIYSTVLGEPLAEPHRGKCGNPGIDYTRGTARNIGDIWLRHSKTIQKFKVGASAGISLSPYGTDAICGAELGYRPLEGLALTASFNRSNRLPTFTDLYYTAKGYIGNPDLKPEDAMTYRLSISYGQKGFNISVSPYYRQGRNIIDWIKTSVDADWQSMQITSLNTAGVETSAGYTSEQGVLREATLSYSYIYTDKGDNGYISKYALDYLKHKGVARLTVAPGGGFTISATASINKRNGNYAAADKTVKEYDLYALLDLRLSWSRKDVMLYVDAENVTNTLYYCYGGLKMPGAWISGGIKYTISRK